MLARQGKNSALKARTGWRACVIALVVGVASVAGVATASGHGKGKGHRAETFAGSCDFSGTVAFSPPLGPATRPTHAVADLDGRCSGSLTSRKGHVRQLDAAPVRYHAASDGTQSCAASSASGQGFFDFGKVRIDFELSETRAGAAAPLSLQGHAGGSFSGVATATGDPAAIAIACAGPGLGRSDITISGMSSPSISG